MTEYHVKQFDGGDRTCDGRNCACATGAMDIAYGTGGDPFLSADEVRDQSGVSCIPGAHSPSGGLYISDIERVCRKNGVAIDFGRVGNAGQPRRWTWTETLARLNAGMWMHVLGDYDQLGEFSAQPGFKGDHSSGSHKRPGQRAGTSHFHDPLRSKPIDLPDDVLRRYSQKPGAEIRGLAGWVTIKEATMQSFTLVDGPAADIVVKDTGAYYSRLKDGSLHKAPVGMARKACIPIRMLKSIVAGKPDTDEWCLGRLIGDEAAFLLERNLTITPVDDDCGDEVAAAEARITTIKAKVAANAADVAND